MKFLILVGDGMGDHPIAELGGKTPLEAAQTPIMDSREHNKESGSSFCERSLNAMEGAELLQNGFELINKLLAVPCKSE